MTNTPPRLFVMAFAALLGMLGPISARAQRVPGRGLNPSRDVAVARYRNDVLKEILPRLARWQEAWNSGEFDELADFYHDDARLLFGPELVVGKEEIRLYFEEIGNSVADMAMAPSDFYVSDRMAVLMGTYSYRVRKNGRLGERVESVYVATFVGYGRTWHIRTQVFRVPFPA